jgi:outer membrane protein assembly factor BamB
MMVARSTKPSAKPLLVFIGVGVGLLLLGVVVAVAATRKNKQDSWPGQGTKWEGTLASTVFALDAETGQLRWQRYLQGEPQFIAMRMSRAGVITLEAIILGGPCTGRPVSLDLDVRTGREVGRRNQLSFTHAVPAPPHGPVVAVDGDNAYRVEAGAAGPVVRAVSAAGATRWQRAFPDPGDHFMSAPTVVAGVVDQAGGGLVVAGSADYLGPRRCGGG